MASGFATRKLDATRCSPPVYALSRPQLQPRIPKCRKKVRMEEARPTNKLRLLHLLVVGSDKSVAVSFAGAFCCRCRCWCWCCCCFTKVRARDRGQVSFRSHQRHVPSRNRPDTFDVAAGPGEAGCKAWMLVCGARALHVVRIVSQPATYSSTGEGGIQTMAYDDDIHLPKGDQSMSPPASASHTCRE